MKIVILTHTFPRFFGDSSAPFMGVLAEALSRFAKLYVLIPFDVKLTLPTKARYKLLSFKYAFFQKMHLLGYSRTLQDDKRIGIKMLLLSPLYILLGSYALLRLIRKEKIDLISAHWIIPNGFISFIVSKICKIPYTVTIPGSDIYLASKSKLYFMMAKVAAEGASVVISDSRRYLNQLSNLKIIPKKTLVINYGVNPAKFKIREKNIKLMKKLRIRKEETVLLSVGRIVQKKGFVYLIRAAAILKSRNICFKLIIIGDGNQKQKLIDEINKLKLNDLVILTGTIDYHMLSKYYNLADIFIMPSIKDDEGNIDASPVALMEAMLSGLMVVTTEETIDINLSKKNEFLKFTKERNPGQIADGVIYLNSYLKRKRNIKMIKSKIRQASLKQFSALSVAKKYISLFKSIG